MALSKPATRQQLHLIESRLLPTWQTAAAIAMHCGLPAKTVVAALRSREREWGLEARVVRIDGHNEVRLYRRRQKILVMGVSFPIDTLTTEEERG